MKVDDVIAKYTKMQIKLNEERSRMGKLYRETKDEELKEFYKLSRYDLGTEVSYVIMFLDDLRMIKKYEQ